MAAATKHAWQVYLVECADGTLYCGVTTDVGRRVQEHNEGNAGAKYTRARRPVKLRHTESFATRAAAQKREYAVKRLPRMEKRRLFRKPPLKRR